ncbi:hypothetical protein ABZ215_35950 [Amycolatopsis sp. NPDC006131]|uniref:hypothetical protein n=1 Tax=Amycolatopsis sp. NPDC006131 TaxID=3156731 RepID=UPI0033A82F33
MRQVPPATGARRWPAVFARPGAHAVQPAPPGRAFPAALSRGVEAGWFVRRPDRAVAVAEAAGEPLALLGAELPADRPGVA